MSSRYAVGIDLGTTHTVVASARNDGTCLAEILPISQIVAPGQVEALPLFPSALFALVGGEHAEDTFGDAPWILGDYARRRGAEVPGRLVASSKSWLAHSGVDRESAILPWGLDEGSDPVAKISPIDAASRLLRHVAHVWDSAHPGSPLASQNVVLTVPASFDEVARALTVRAAERAGITAALLEEPQAAFYDWMARAGPSAVAALADSTGGEALVLVVDVGGGTTDVSLIRARADGRVERVAVGPHLLLGGDNMDLALARICEDRLIGAGQDDRLDVAHYAQLALGCRAAKEKLLSDDPPEDVAVALLGRGSGLVGAARRTRLGRSEVEDIVLDGFFPNVDADARPQRSRGALVAFGLPYERDVAITRHIAAFVARHLPTGVYPNAVLFNGGVFRAGRIAARVLETMARWRGGAAVHRLADSDPELGVARGAVAFALARIGHGTRLGGGSARAYFVGVDSDDRRDRAVCVVPRGAEEGAVHRVTGRTFELGVGRRVRFELFASDEADANVGDVVDIEGESFARLNPIAANIEGTTSEVRVELEGELTAVGTLGLAVAVVDADPPRRFELAFELRAASPSSRPPALEPSKVPSGKLQQALELIDRTFGKPRSDATGREAKDLVRELTRVLGERQDWTLEVNRMLFDGLVPNARGRRRSADHERVFWLLAGYCVRPGFGHPLDSSRATTLGRLFDERLSFPSEMRGWQQFWIAWRRTAAGLDERVQTAIRDYADAHLAPAAAGIKRPKKPALSLDDALVTCASLERVDAARRAQLGSWILERTWTERDPRLWAALGRLGARVPAYASAHHVVAVAVAERWLDHLLREKWESLPTAIGAALAMARRTGDRSRDVSERVAREVDKRLSAVGVDGERLRAVREVVEVDAVERQEFYGETLPLGLRLID